MSLMQSPFTYFLLLFSNMQLFVFAYVCVSLSCTSHTLFSQETFYTPSMCVSSLFKVHFFLLKKLLYHSQWKVDIPQNFVNLSYRLFPNGLRNDGGGLIWNTGRKGEATANWYLNSVRHHPFSHSYSQLRIQPPISFTRKSR